MAFTSVESRALEMLQAHIETLPWVRLVNSEKERISGSEFQPHECPCVQFVTDQQATSIPERNDMIFNWPISIELITVPEVTGEASKKLHLDLMRELRQHIGAFYRLDGTVPGIVGFYLTGFQVDLHLIEPYYVGTLFFDFRYRDYFTQPC